MSTLPTTRIATSSLFALALPFALVACGGGAGEPVKAPSREAQSVLPTKASPGIEILGEAPAGVVDRARRILSLATRARHLAPKEAVKLQALAPADLVGIVKKHVAEEVPKDEIRAEGVAFAGLGLIPADYDYESETYALLEEQLAGLYIPEAKTMYIATTVPGDEVESTLAHELVHALQDQHFDLGRRMKFRPGASDELSALSSLAEGDATVAMFDEMILAQQGEQALEAHDTSQTEDVDPWRFLDATAGKPGTSKLTSAPRFIALGLVAPYADGMAFVNGLRRRGGWRAVDAAWSKPPTSTEQLIHLDKYLSGEPALTLPPATANALGATYKKTWDDVFGEQEMRLAFSVWMTPSVAVHAAEGWAGDRVTLFEAGGGKTAVAWTMAFDDDPQEKEAFAALVDGWDAQYPGVQHLAAPFEIAAYGLPPPAPAKEPKGKAKAKATPPPKPAAPALPELPAPPGASATATSKAPALKGCRAVGRNGRTVVVVSGAPCDALVSWTGEVGKITP